ncbi:MAG TPA: hypothetical protein VMI10_24910 [Terriglobales bacterium]|nr:hypothetical protein [Terriglobales bacterium]
MDSLPVAGPEVLEDPDDIAAFLNQPCGEAPARSEPYQPTAIEKLLDPCARKHGGNEESRAANWHNLKHRPEQRHEVYALISNAGPQGLSMKEVATIMGVQLNTISGRGTELKKLGLVEPTAEVRAGSMVLRAIQPKTPETNQMRKSATKSHDEPAFLNEVPSRKVAA